TYSFRGTLVARNSLCSFEQHIADGLEPIRNDAALRHGKSHALSNRCIPCRRTAKYAQIFFWERLGRHVFISHNVRGFSLRQQFAVIGAHQFISEVDYRLADIFQLRTHDYLIIVTDGRFVPAAGIDHSYEASVVMFHIAIGKAEWAELFNSSYLVIDYMSCMISHDNLISIG